ncbi:MAG: peptide chain release factor N(5)-glutamine methyltransferase [Gemmatimonadaceae bacterium]
MSAIIPEPDARELLALLFDKPRHWTSTSKDELLQDADLRAATDAASRLASGMPMQYAARRAAFRHLTLYVDERVLIPRPETEVLVDIVLEHSRASGGGVAADVGTGSGAIAIALATEGRFDRVIATDVSVDALSVARRNAQAVAPTTPLEFRQGSLLGPVPERGLRAVVSNPPYISFDEAGALPALVRDWEPSVALFSPADGMALTARLVREASRALGVGGLLALEVDVRRASLVAELVSALGTYEDVRVALDLTGRERFVVARRRETAG